MTSSIFYEYVESLKKFGTDICVKYNTVYNSCIKPLYLLNNSLKDCFFFVAKSYFYLLKTLSKSNFVVFKHL